jgi:large subunit ribosomal protein L19
VKRSGKVRRAKLYYLRDRIGKAVRLKERIPKQRASQAELLAAKAQKREARKAKKAAKAEAKAARTEEKVTTKGAKGKTKPKPAAEAPPQEPTAEE